jgi:ABC-type sugar transport system ATPase subunit
MAILVASSDTSEISGFCDTIGSFYRGSLTALKPHDEWTDETLLAEVMRGGATDQS